MLWTACFRNGVTALMLDSHSMEKGLRHKRLVLGEALVEVEKNTMKDGRMASAPPVEGADPKALIPRQDR